MDDSLKPIFSDLRDNMNKALDHLRAELTKVRAGKAHPSMLDGVQVEYYGSMVPLNQVGSINTPDARTLVVQPWEKTILRDIERSIINANLGYNPQNDGEIIIINIPPLTEERRMSLVKTIKTESENAKVSLRNLRRDANTDIKKLQKDGLSEDMAKDAETRVQKETDDYSAQVDSIIAQKEKEIMTI
ncbi:MAG: ribosome recycling factor [Flavobacteriales bacterium]|nr:ribosome recycling factor [Bacteroidota bacterium]MCB9241034.1 ribosome recycling factor [Flavobacteriales bacterium]